MSGDVIARYPTRGGSHVLVARLAGRWRRYIWHCLGCGEPPEPRRRLRRSTAKRRGHRHAIRCRAGDE